MLECVEDEVEAVLERGREVVADVGDVPGDHFSKVRKLVSKRAHLSLVLPDAAAALGAAAHVQRDLQGGPIRVRIGLHTGQPLVTAEGYVGMDVHQGARVMGAGHGGQVLVSEATARLAGGIDLRDLGPHRLKDLSGPQRLFQLGEGEFPPLKTLHQTNLPIQPTPLLGRQQELAELGAVLAHERLVTLTGPGGSGKTRLALQLAAEAVEEFRDGVWWVPLQALRDPALVLSAIAQALGASDDLHEYIGDKRLLVLLDNLEQVVEAAPEIAELLAATPDLKLLATSREPLRIAGEVEYVLEPLREDDAVELFLARAHETEPLEVVREICRRLDGLPLALELAAARTKLLPPAQLLARLEQRLPLLTGGRRDVPERQRTLRATIQWSYELLDREEKKLFARLAVFAGSFEPEAADAVCQADPDTLQSLLEKSLVRRWGSGRFGMLETIHEYATERLQESGDRDDLRRRHAEYFAALASKADVRGRHGALWLERLAAERPNLRAALVFARDAQLASLELQLAANLAQFWFVNGEWSESRAWLADALSRDGPADASTRATALARAAFVENYLGHLEQARVYAAEAVAIGRKTGEHAVLAEALSALAVVVHFEGNHEAGVRLHEECIELARVHGPGWVLGSATNNLGWNAASEGKLERATALLEESLASAREWGDEHLVALVLLNLAYVELELGNTRAARKRVVEGLRVAHRLNLKQSVAIALEALGAIASAEGDNIRAARLLGAADVLFKEMESVLSQLELSVHERTVARAHGELGVDGTGQAWAEGQAMPLERAVLDALACADADLSESRR